MWSTGSQRNGFQAFPSLGSKISRQLLSRQRIMWPVRRNRKTSPLVPSASRFRSLPTSAKTKVSEPDTSHRESGDATAVSDAPMAIGGDSRVYFPAFTSHSYHPFAQPRTLV